MRPFIFLLYFCLILCKAPVLLYAQEEYAGGGTQEQWQLTFDTIRTKVNGLLVRNNQLSAEYRQLQDALTKTQAAIVEQDDKNASMRQFLKERHGRTDQQVRLEELAAQLKLAKTQLAVRQGQALELKDKLAQANKTVDLKKTRVADLELRQNMPAVTAAVVAPTSGDAELDGLRKELEDQKAEEVHLEDQLSAMMTQAEHPEMVLLKEKLDFLQRQKDELLKGAPVEQARKSASEIDRKMYFAAIEQKAKLESKIHRFENQINMLKNASGVSVSWAAQKKKLIHDVVQMDAHNAQLREKINNLRQDIALLKEQVDTLQKQVKK